jgi:TRAP-type C4-dicarboxylate transport system substrate-binding protein
VEVIELSEAERAAFAAATASVQQKWAPRIGEALMDAARQAVAQP